MKNKRFLFIAVLIMLFAGAFAFTTNELSSDADKGNKNKVTGVVTKIISDTVSNSMHETGYLEFEPNRIVDSVQFVQYARGEVDVDRFIATKAFGFESTPGFNLNTNFSTLAGDTTTLTTNLDSNVALVTYIVTWAGSKLTGANKVYCQVDAASSGNDAADPNVYRLFGIVFYRPE